MRTRVYVDGLNLYYGALKGTPYKWLNLASLSARLLPSKYVIDKILYFTAHVSGISDAEAPARQHAYLSALRTLPNVEIKFGNFLTKTVWRPLVNLPVADRQIKAPNQVTLPEGDFVVAGQPDQILPVGRYAESGKSHRRRKVKAPLQNAVIAEFHTAEEKGSDVNLASHFLNDAWKGSFDAAAVISNDTDLVTPIQMVAEDQGKPVFIVCPGRWQVAHRLREAATYVRHIREPMLIAAQFPETLADTTLAKPPNW